LSVSARPTLEHLPLALLAMPMGTGGVGLAWREAHRALGAPAAIGEALLAFTALLWLAVVALHLGRLVRHPAAASIDARHPVRVAFSAAPTIGLMIVAAFLHRYAPVVAVVLFGIAVALHLLVATMLLRRILAARGAPAILAPPLMIPLVGNVLAPVFGPPMGFLDLSWMMFGVGVLLWLMVAPLLLHRLIAGPPLPPALKPTIAIFLAPPAVAALALVALTGDQHGPALMFTGVALLMAAVLISLAVEIARAPFAMPWWGTTFPAAALAAMLMVQGFPGWLCWPALLFATALTAWVAWRTALMAQAGAFFRQEA
jgi:tellurite resistance protein